MNFTGPIVEYGRTGDCRCARPTRRNARHSGRVTARNERDYNRTGIPITGQIHQTKMPITIISNMLAGMPAIKNSEVLNCPLS